jgi:hypothetical protein
MYYWHSRRGVHFEVDFDSHVFRLGTYEKLVMQYFGHSQTRLVMHDVNVVFHVENRYNSCHSSSKKLIIEFLLYLVQENLRFP